MIGKFFKFSIAEFASQVAAAKPDEIRQNITKAFKRTATLDANKINIETFSHKVVLSGTVRTLEEKKAAEEAAFAVQGITEVENNIIVEPDILIC